MAGGRGLAGGFISKAERERAALPFGSCLVKDSNGSLVILLRGSGDRDSAATLGGGIPTGDCGQGPGGGRRGLIGRPGRTGSGLFGGSIHHHEKKKTR